MSQSHLVACPSCARHVRVSEQACPFCAASLSDALRASPVPQPPGTRLTRAALVAFGTGALAVASGCSDGSTNVVQFYGAPPIEATDGGDAGAQQGEPAYGGAPIDLDGGAAPDTGVAPVYGASPSDAGH
jgi:hypothetical protein